MQIVGYNRPVGQLDTFVTVAYISSPLQSTTGIWHLIKIVSLRQFVNRLRNGHAGIQEATVWSPIHKITYWIDILYDSCLLIFVIMVIFACNSHRWQIKIILKIKCCRRQCINNGEILPVYLCQQSAPCNSLANKNHSARCVSIWEGKLHPLLSEDGNCSWMATSSA